MQSQGIQLLSNPTSWATTMVLITGITKLPFPRKKMQTLDFTDLNSANNYEQLEISLLRRNEELEFEYNQGPGAVSTRLEAVDTLIEAAVLQYFKITIPSVTKIFWFSGFVTSHDPGQGDVGAQKVSGKFKVMPSGIIYFQTATPT